jgi:hypothetical protein
MNGFKKLVLASAVLAATSGAYAMEAMDDESMSSTTGQDGLTISLNSNITDLVITYVDRSGYDVAPSSFSSAGAVVIDDVDVGISNLVITLDAGGSAGTTAGSGMLNIGVTMASLNIGLGGTVIGVADAQATGSTVGAVKGIISFSATAALSIGSTAMNIQLGNETQGAMVTMGTTISEITLTGMSINDVAGANQSGSISIGTLRLSNVTVANSIDVVSGGLRVDTTGTSIASVGLERVVLGDVAQVSIGDIYLSNLDVDSVITITGHP